MKILIFGEKQSQVEKLIQGFGFARTERNPELVIAYGGDGTLMRAEHAHPGIPKVLLKGSRICKRCSSLSNEEVLRRIKAGEYGIEELPLLQARAHQTVLRALNDVIVHNADPRHAIRYTLWVDDESIGEEIVGDGIVVATPFGSTGYYRSITDSFFAVGLGLAFNNSTEQSDHMVLRPESKIRVQITRGPAVVYADNQSESIALTEGDEVLMQQSSQTARLLQFD